MGYSTRWNNRETTSPIRLVRDVLTTPISIVTAMILAMCGLSLIPATSALADTVAVPDSASGSALVAAPAPHPYDQTFSLHSDPGAPQVIYLDFVGSSVQSGGDAGTDTPYSLDGDPSSFSDAEMDVIQNVWARVSENFTAFHVDVTTESPDVSVFTSGGGVRVDITNGGTTPLANDCAAPCVGLAFVGTWGYVDPAAVVLPQSTEAGNAGNPELIAEVATHEVGHTLGLGHDTTSSATSLWGAVMAPAYQDTPLEQWTSTAPSGLSGGDELSTIEQTLAPRSDGYGQSFAEATPLTGSSFDVSGTIAGDTETDWFSFTVPQGAGPLTLDVAPSQYTSMLDIDATLFDSSGTQLIDSNPTATFVSPSAASGLDAPFTNVSLSPGSTYYLRVQGAGGPGYSNYGSIGSYTITGAYACVAGSYSATGYAPCTPAPAGSFVDSPGATSATPCPLGTYQPNTGQTACLLADPGNFVDAAGAIAETPCPVGYYQPNSGQISCIAAPAGSYVGQTGSIASTPCALGTYQPNSGQASCLDAPAGSYVGVTGSASAASCSTGYYQDLAGQTTCKPAPPGTYVATVGATSVTQCALGTYQPNSASTLCVLAEPGNFVDSMGSPSETACPVGTYQPNSGQSSCLPAPVNTFVDTTGATAPTPCPAGTYQPLTGQSSCLQSPPTVNAAGPYSGTEGVAVSLNGMVTGTNVTTQWTYVANAGTTGTCAFGDASSPVTTVTCSDQGSYTLTLTANDGVNAPVSNDAQLTVTQPVTTAYTIKPLFDQRKAAEEGSTIPVKLQVLDAHGHNVSSTNLTVTAVDVDGNSHLLHTDGHANPRNVFRYDRSLRGYILNLNTDGLRPGTHTLHLTIGSDQTVYSLTFVIRDNQHGHGHGDH